MNISNLLADRSVQAAGWPAVAFYRGMFDRRTPEELRIIARVKRFTERFRADAQWRAALRADPTQAQVLFRAQGIELDAELVAPMWLQSTSSAGISIAPKEATAMWESSAPLRLWREWLSDMTRYRDLCRDAADTADHHPRFEAWRRRQLRRLAHELEPLNATAINSPLIAYELSSGCSVGCWFCGISAERFGGYLPYDTTTAELWRGILETVVERFGRAAATGFCYWATDPCDNPDYSHFIEDHRRITGVLPPTTTAIPMRSPAQTREILALGDRYRHGNNRFSVLTLKALNLIHENFDADDLLTVDLVLQMNGSLTTKAKAGRGLLQSERIERLAPVDRVDSDLEQHSIACVTGFLIDMPKRTLRLVSPCRANEREPDGYHVFAEKPFTSIADFAAVLDLVIAENALDHPRQDTVMAFHQTVRTRFEEGVLIVQSRGQEARVMPFPFLPRLVELIQTRRYSFNELIHIVTDDFPNDLLSVGVVLQDLFESGLFEESAQTTSAAVPTVSTTPML